MDIAQAASELRSLTFHDLGFAKVDRHRPLRCGFNEVILSQGKTPEEVEAIADSIVSGGGDLLATRAGVEHYQAVRRRFPEATYHEKARLITLKRNHRPRPDNPIAVVCAGTSDMAVAEEAKITAEMLDNEVTTFYDVGVAGLHRLLASHAELQQAGAIVAVAGMEGALPSVVGGLVARPVIAVPTSVGYGASFGGIAPLLTMLNTCTPGVAVVNIDNGFGAGHIASLINRTGMDREGD